MAIKDKTRKILWGKSGNQCAFPGCEEPLTREADEVGGSPEPDLRGQEAHIRSRTPQGPRYDLHYPVHKIDSAENLLLLCLNHHGDVDANSGGGYSIQYLERIKSAHERHKGRLRNVALVVNTYLSASYAKEQALKFNQVDLHTPTVEATFVDVLVGVRPSSELASLFESIQRQAPGDQEALNDPEGDFAVGGAQLLLDPQWKGNAILSGGPGQGKSTLLQYICQFYRAKRLGENAYGAQNESLVRRDAVQRVPLRIDLKKYAQWALHESGRIPPRSAHEKSSDEDTKPLASLELYLMDQVQQSAGPLYIFDKHDLVALLSTYPLLIALDGLDEVANVSIRNEVAEAIRDFSARVSRDAADLSILVATRPGGSLGALTGSGGFPLVRLKKLTQGLRLQYLDRWVQFSSLDAEEANRLREIFNESANIPHIRELASYPMQLAILLHLLHRKQLLPQKRAELYREYLEVFLDREQAERKERLLDRYRPLMISTHAYLAWHLHSQTEQGKSTGAIKKDQLKELLQSHLYGREDDARLVEEFYSAITTRVLCLIEREEGFLEFEVQSLQEYFAADHLFENLPANGPASKDQGLKAMLERPYWSNVARFFIGRFTTGEVRGLRDIFEEVDQKLAPHPMTRSMGLLALADRNFDDLKEHSVERIVEFVLDGPGLLYGEEGIFETAGDRMEFGERAGKAQAVSYLKRRLTDQPNDPLHETAARVLRRHGDWNDLKTWWWENFTKDRRWIEVGAGLGAFQDLTPIEAEQLAQCLEIMSPGRESVASLLYRGGYNGEHDVVIQTIVSSLSLGGILLTDSYSGDSALNTLISLARAAMLTGAKPRNRYAEAEHIHSTSGQLAAILQSDGKLDEVNVSSADPGQWAEWIQTSFSVWNKGTICQIAVANTPLSVDLESLAMKFPVDSPLRQMTRVENERRHKTKDPDWWKHHLAAAPDDAETRFRLTRLLALCQSNVLINLAEDINEIVSQMTSEAYKELEAGVNVATLAGSRKLELKTSLRQKKELWSPPVLWLLHYVANESTAELISEISAKHLSDIFRAGPRDGNEVVAFIKFGKRKIAVDCFANSANIFFKFQFDTARLKNVKSKALGILEEPYGWPRDIIHLALEDYTETLERKRPPLAEIATRDGWFDQEF